MIVLINFDFFLILVFSSVFGPTLNPPSAAKPQLQASTQLVQLSRRSCPPSSRFPQSVCSVISTGKCLHKQHRQCYGPTKTKLIHKKKWFLDHFFLSLLDPLLWSHPQPPRAAKTHPHPCFSSFPSRIPPSPVQKNNEGWANAGGSRGCW